MYDPVADIDRLMDAARAAPSVLNTQPWLFQIVASDRISLRAQRARWLQHIDPEKRELAISYGAALFNLRLALRNAGHDYVVWLMPDENNDPDLLASVEIVTGRVGVGVRESAPGVAETFDLDPERVREVCVQDALALARITDGASA